MKFSRITFRFAICILCVSISFTGCHSYFVIQEDEYNKIETMEDIKIVYTNGKEFVVERNDTTNVHIVGASLIVYEGTHKKIISMDEIRKLKESRFDLGGTITVIIIPLIILVAFTFAISSINL